MDAWAVVVARQGPGAKSRLAGALAPEERSTLAVAMLADVIRATSAAGLAGTIAVLDRSVPVAGVRVLRDPGGGLNGAVEAGVGEAVAMGAEIALVLPGDIPLLDADDLRGLVALASTAERMVIVATDRHGTGTNALVLRPPRIVSPAFGPGSAERHLASAIAAGALPRRVDCAGIALDIDTPLDLAELVRRSPGGATAGALARVHA